MFWTENIGRNVQRMNLATKYILTWKRKSSTPYAITLDCTNKRVYWIEHNLRPASHSIFSSDYHGRHQKRLTSTTIGPLNGNILGVFGDSLYFQKQNHLYLNKMNVTSRNIPGIILVGKTSYTQLIVVDNSLQPMGEFNIIFIVYLKNSWLLANNQL